MVKKRMTLSLIALISSVFLFVLASFAWLAVSEIVNIGGNTVDVVDLNVEAVLEVSDDGETYVPATNIEFTNATPGTIKYYRLNLTNVGNIDCYTKVTLQNFVDDVNDPSTTYDDTKSLRDVIVVNTSNTVNSETIVDHTLTELLPEIPSGDYSSASMYLVTSIYLGTDTGVDDTATLYFTFTVSGTAGNDYQNLELSIERLMVASATP